MIEGLFLLIGLLLLIFTGIPIFISITIVAVISALAMGVPFQMTIIKLFGSVNSFSLMAIPFFIIAGNIMTKAQITDKLVDFAKALLGNTKGGLAHCTTFASFLFGGIQGSGIANASAIGGMLIPAMEKQGYSKDYAVVVTTSSSMMSPIVPPSIAMILYSFYTEVPVGKLFIGGFIPGLLLCAGLIAVNYFLYIKRDFHCQVEPFSLKNVFKSFIKSLGALTMPLIILVGILSGLVTPTESGVLAITYGIVYGMFITHTLKLKDLVPIIFESAKTTSVVMLIIAAAGILSNVLVRMHFQAEVLHLAVEVLQNPYLASLFLMAVFLVLGMFLDPTVLIAMFATTVLTVGKAFNFDPIHYGVLMVIVMQIGAIPPPVGTFLFISCGIGKLPLEKSVKPMMPYLIVIIALSMLLLFVPSLVTFLPNAFSS